MGDKADWQGVGDSLKKLGATLTGHATDGTEKVKAASGDAGPGAVDQVKAGGKAAVDKFDETTKDPEVGAALKDATNKFLDAVKVSLTGGDTPATEPSAEPEPPKPIEPPQE
ncbi:MAG: hypothetical protein WCP95_07005 [Actinomycetes bacterium]